MSDIECFPELNSLNSVVNNSTLNDQVLQSPFTFDKMPNIYMDSEKPSKYCTSSYVSTARQNTSVFQVKKINIAGIPAKKNKSQKKNASSLHDSPLYHYKPKEAPHSSGGMKQLARGWRRGPLHQKSKDSNTPDNLIITNINATDKDDLKNKYLADLNPYDYQSPSSEGFPMRFHKPINMGKILDAPIHVKKFKFQKLLNKSFEHATRTAYLNQNTNQTYFHIENQDTDLPFTIKNISLPNDSCNSFSFPGNQNQTYENILNEQKNDNSLQSSVKNSAKKSRNYKDEFPQNTNQESFVQKSSSDVPNKTIDSKEKIIGGFKVKKKDRRKNKYNIENQLLIRRIQYPQVYQSPSNYGNTSKTAPGTAVGMKRSISLMQKNLNSIGPESFSVQPISNPEWTTPTKISQEKTSNHEFEENENNKFMNLSSPQKNISNLLGKDYKESFQKERNQNRFPNFKIKKNPTKGKKANLNQLKKGVPTFENSVVAKGVMNEHLFLNVGNSMPQSILHSPKLNKKLVKINNHLVPKKFTYLFTKVTNPAKQNFKNLSAKEKEEIISKNKSLITGSKVRNDSVLVKYSAIHGKQKTSNTKMLQFI